MDHYLVFSSSTWVGIKETAWSAFVISFQFQLTIAKLIYGFHFYYSLEKSSYCLWIDFQIPKPGVHSTIILVQLIFPSVFSVEPQTELLCSQNTPFVSANSFVHVVHSKVDFLSLIFAFSHSSYVIRWSSDAKMSNSSLSVLILLPPLFSFQLQVPSFLS